MTDAHLATPQRPALLYTRVSTRGQEEDGTSLDSQEAACRAYAAAHGYAVGRVTREVYSGAELWDRPQLSRDREDIRAGVYSALICHATDRLSRNPVHVLLLVEECDRAGVALLFVTEPLDSTPEGQLIHFVRGWAAQVEREKIRERQMRAKRQRALNGKIHGAGIDLYGYRRDKAAGVRLVYEPEALIVRRAYDWIVDERLGITGVARRLNAANVPPPSAGKVRYADPDRVPRWQKSQILHLVRNPAYKGVAVAWRWQGDGHGARQARPESDWIPLPEGVTPPLVSPEQWEQAQRVITERQARTVQRNAVRFSLLRSMIWCGRCSRRMHPDSENTRTAHATRTYRCASRQQAAYGACGAKRVRAEAVEAWVWDTMAAFIRDPDHALAAIAANASGAFNAPGGVGGASRDAATPLQRDRDAAAREAARIEARQSDLLARFGASGDGGDFPWELVEREVSRLEREKRQWRATMAELDERLTARAATQAEAVTARERLAALRPLVSRLTQEQRRDVLEAFGARVACDGGHWRLSLVYPTDVGGEMGMGVEFTS